MIRFVHAHVMFAIPTALCSLSATVAYGQSTCAVDVSKPGAVVADICRGQQLEEFNYQFEGGLYAQLIRNPSFEGIKDPIAAWYLIKPGSSNAYLYPQTSADTQMLNGYQIRCIKLQVASVNSGSVGLANGGYWASVLARKDPPVLI